MHFSKFFDKLGRVLTGIKLPFIFFLPFLCKDVTSPNFKGEGKLADLIAAFILVYKMSANISIFSLIILVGISVLCEVLVLSHLRISLSVSLIFTSSK